MNLKVWFWSNLQTKALPAHLPIFAGTGWGHAKQKALPRELEAAFPHH